MHGRTADEAATHTECPACGAFEVRAHTADCFSCHGDTARACQACFGGYCAHCGVSMLPGEPYSDDPPPEVKLAIAQALGMLTLDEVLWQSDEPEGLDRP